MSLADAKIFKQKFFFFFLSKFSFKTVHEFKCFAALPCNIVSVRCNASNKGFHQKCSTRPKDSTRDDQWKCNKCTKLQQYCLAASTNCQLSESTYSTFSQPQPVTFQNKLKIYRWNANSIRPKFLELHDPLINSDVDVLAVQESKLQKADKTPLIEGYVTVREDQNNIL